MAIKSIIKYRTINDAFTINLINAPLPADLALNG